MTTCPVHNKPLERLKITQGDQMLGYIFVCPRNDWGSEHADDCDYCLDGDENGEVVLEELCSICARDEYAH